ncbi:hypothetical protein [Humisphaera borealis]|uniref:Uncharacterized protein n=1 Tax=Humisphaera borealis TaxID=2807512 RepID=A0A7M2X1V1_9BACT|nr:hypothetical protein [Humisphaera borealis]QOV91736.1 hypothetical protein IPV69_10405 [Humisphaera borealis]
MRIKTLIAAALAASTLMSAVPLQAGYSYGTPRFTDRGPSPREDYRQDYGRDSRYAPRMFRLGAVSTCGDEYQNDVFEVCDRQRYTAVVFKVERGAVAIDRIRVTFGDDSSFLPETKVVFNEGDRTCRIDLPGYAREIKRIRIRYQSLTRGVSIIEAYGVPAN